MEDRRKDIPIGCAVNVLIINELAKGEDFKKACIEIPRKFNITSGTEESWPFFNISWLAYMMYSIFVVSKEIYKIDDADEFFQKLIAKDIMGNFSIIKEKRSFKDQPTYHFRSFRNAISHVNYEVDDNTIRFWDHPPKKHEDIHWQVKISHNDFRTVLGTLNEANFEFYNQIKEGQRDENGKKI